MNLGKLRNVGHKKNSDTVLGKFKMDDGLSELYESCLTRFCFDRNFTNHGERLPFCADTIKLTSVYLFCHLAPETYRNCQTKRRKQSSLWTGEG